MTNHTIQLSVEEGMQVQQFLEMLVGLKLGYSQGIEAAQQAFLEWLYMQKQQPKAVQPPVSTWPDGTEI